MATGINTITDVLNQWSEAGVFAYLLPFLFIFAVVFGILSKTKVLGDNKGVQATIALAIGLLSLQFDYVSNFFSIFLPYAGIGIAILLIGIRFAQFKAMSLMYVALVLGVKRLYILIATIIGGELFHDSRILRKSIAAIIMVGGAILLAL